LEESKKKMIAGAGIASGIALILLLLRKGGGAPPPPPGMANLFGQVTDAETSQPIEGIEVSLAEYSAVTEQNGYYLIEEIAPGGYEITFNDPLGRYEILIL
jgi:hypothetical protein